MPSFFFENDKSYVVAGGLSVTGRSIAQCMVDRGARHLILLSRSGARNDDAVVLLRDLEVRNI